MYNSSLGVEAHLFMCSHYIAKFQFRVLSFLLSWTVAAAVAAKRRLRLIMTVEIVNEIFYYIVMCYKA